MKNLSSENIVKVELEEQVESTSEAEDQHKTRLQSPILQGSIAFNSRTDRDIIERFPYIDEETTTTNILRLVFYNRQAERSKFY